jgi:hypothetical protein
LGYSKRQCWEESLELLVPTFKQSAISNKCPNDTPQTLENRTSQTQISR